MEWYDVPPTQLELSGSMAWDADPPKPEEIKIEPKTIPGKIYEGLKTAARFPLGMPTRPSDISLETLHPLAKPVIALEEAGREVKRTSAEALGEHLRTTPSRFPVTRGVAAGSLDVAATFAPFTPSEFAGYAAGVMPQIKLLQRSTPVVRGLEKEAKALAGVETPVSMAEAGTALKGQYTSNLGKLRQAEQQAYKPLEEKLQNTPAKVDNAIEYIKDLFQMEKGLLSGETESGIPVSIVRQQYPEYIPPVTPKTLAAIEEANPALPSKDYGIFAKILRVGQKEDLTANDVKGIRTVIGEKIDWNAPRSDTLNYHLKNLYRALSDDYADAATAGGFAKEAETAKQSTKDFYKYLNLPTSKVSQRSNYASKAAKTLIDNNTPEAVNELYSTINQGTKEQVKKAWMQNILQKSPRETPSGTEVDIKKMVTHLRKYSPEYIDALFGKDSGKVKDLMRASDYTIQQTKMGAPYAPFFLRPLEYIGNIWRRLRAGVGAEQIIKKEITPRAKITLPPLSTLIGSAAQKKENEKTSISDLIRSRVAR